MTAHGKHAVTPTGVVLIAVLLVVPSTAFTQSFFPGVHSLDTPYDPGSIAAGESFVAVRKNRYASTYNPAGLSGIEGFSVSFARRNFDHYNFTANSKYIAFTATVSTPEADLAIVYNRFYQGEITFTTAQSPEGVATGEVSDYVLGVSAATQIIKGIDVGIQVKTFRPVVTITSGSLASLPEANSPILVDLGLIGTLGGQLTSTSVAYAATAGLAIQNFGTDLKESSTDPTSNTEREQILTVPRTLRTGIAFTVATPRSAGLGLSPVSFMVTGEYRLILNSRADPKNEFWGYGAELVVLEMFTGRIGGFLQSFTNIYGLSNTPALRFGAGVKIPFGMMGLGAPLALCIDYAAIPLNARVYVPLENSTLHAFSVGVVYEEDIFQRAE